MNAFKTESGVQPLVQKYFNFVFTEIMISSARPGSIGGAYASSRTLSAGCGGRGRSRWTGGSDADGEVVWSWHPGADAKFARLIGERADDGGKNAGPRGEHV